MSKKQIKAKKKEKYEGKRTGKTVKSKKKTSDKLVKVEKELISIPKCHITKTSLELDESISFKEYIQIGSFLNRIGASVLFWFGDWYNFSKAKQIFQNEKSFWDEALKIYSERTIENAAYVCRRIEPSRRRENVSYSNHQVVAPLSPEDQDKWLREAEKHKYSVMELRKKIKDAQESAKIEKSEDSQLVKDFYGKLYPYMDYIASVTKALRKCWYIIDPLIWFKKHNSYRFNHHHIDDEDRFINVCKHLLKDLKFLLDENNSHQAPQEKTEAEVKKEKVAPEDIENLVDD